MFELGAEKHLADCKLYNTFCPCPCGGSGLPLRYLPSLLLDDLLHLRHLLLHLRLRQLRRGPHVLQHVQDVLDVAFLLEAGEGLRGGKRVRPRTGPRAALRIVQLLALSPVLKPHLDLPRTYVEVIPELLPHRRVREGIEPERVLQGGAVEGVEDPAG